MKTRPARLCVLSVVAFLIGAWAVVGLATPGQVGAHLRRPGYEGVTMCTYVLPSC